MLHHPADGYDKFEEISELVKATNFKIRDPKTDFDVNGAAGLPHKTDAMKKALDKIRNLIAEVPDLVKPEDKHLIAKDKPCVIQNFVDHAAILEWSGIGFGEERSFLI